MNAERDIENGEFSPSNFFFYFPDHFRVYNSSLSRYNVHMDSNSQFTQEDLLYGSQKLRRRFVVQMMRYGHLKGGQTKAAIAAGYSPNTATAIASELMGDPEIKAMLQTELERRQERTSFDADKIVKELAKMAFADVNDIVEWAEDKISVKDSVDLTPEETATIASICETKIKGGGRKIEVKQHDKLKALELLGKTLCIWKDKQVDPNAQIGGVLKVPPQQSVDEWEAQELRQEQISEEP